MLDIRHIVVFLLAGWTLATPVAAVTVEDRALQSLTASRELLAAGAIGDAVDTFLRAHQLDGKVLLVDDGSHLRALIAARRGGMKKGAADAVDHFKLAELLDLGGYGQEALEQYQASLRANPGSPVATTATREVARLQETLMVHRFLRQPPAEVENLQALVPGAMPQEMGQGAGMGASADALAGEMKAQTQELLKQREESAVVVQKIMDLETKLAEMTLHSQQNRNLVNFLLSRAGLVNPTTGQLQQ